MRSILYKNHFRGENDPDYDYMIYGQRERFKKFKLTEEFQNKLTVHHLNYMHEVYFKMIRHLGPTNVDYYNMVDLILIPTLDCLECDEFLHGGNIFTALHNDESIFKAWFMQLSKSEKKDREEDIGDLENINIKHEDDHFITMADYFSQCSKIAGKDLIVLKFLFYLGHHPRFASFVPKSKYKILKENIEDILISLPEVLGTTSEETELIIKKLVIEENKNAVSEEEAEKFSNYPGISLFNDTVIFDGYEFFDDWIDSVEMIGAIQNVCFRNCLFNKEDIEVKTRTHFVLFYNCIFKQTVRIYDTNILEINNCKFMSPLLFQNVILHTTSFIWIHDSTFDKKSKLTFENIRYNSNYKRGLEEITEPYFNLTDSKIHLIKIENTAIQSDVLFKNIGTEFEELPAPTRNDIIPDLKINLSLSNVYFAGKLNIIDFPFGKDSTFENIVFPSTPSSENFNTRKHLYEAMQKSGFEEKAKELGILSTETKKKSNKIDMDAYQTAYASGFLNPDFAAFCIGKSKPFLAKKRQDDRKKLSKNSIPFVVSGRDIQYPVEALLAFKAHNWDRLKELRTKYPIPKN